MPGHATLPELSLPEDWTCEVTHPGLMISHRAAPYGAVFIDRCDATLSSERPSIELEYEGWSPCPYGLMRQRVTYGIDVRVIYTMWLVANEWATFLVQYLAVDPTFILEMPVIEMILRKLHAPKSPLDDPWGAQVQGFPVVR